MAKKKPKSEKLKEAQRMKDLREQGATLEEIGEEFGYSETTVRRRLKLWQGHIGEKTETDEERLEDAGAIIQTVRGILSDAKTSERLGEITGADVSTIEETVKRIMNKTATKKEIHRIFTNVAGAIRGYTEGKEVHRMLDLPDRESVAKSEELEELKEELRELKATVGNPKTLQKIKKKEKEEDEED